MNRITWVDLLRAFGIILIFASHIFGTNNFGLQLLFGFNVLLLVILSRYVSVESSNCDVKKYYVKGFKHLILHTWIFFTLYFVLILLFSIGKDYPYSLTQIVRSYLFMDSIGYTWIITIFIFIALATPLYRFILKSIPYSEYILPLIYVAASGVLFIMNVNCIITKAFLYISGYIVLSFIGYLLYLKPRIRVKLLIGSTVFSIVLVCYMLFRGMSIFNISGYKYPPNAYYIAYGATVTLTLITILSEYGNIIEQKLICSVYTYISKNSFDLYLWHIFGLYIAGNITYIYLKFVCVVGVAFLGNIIYKSVSQKIGKLAVSGKLGRYENE